MITFRFIYSFFGYIAAFLWSIITERAFLILRVDDIEKCNQRTAEFAYDPRYINWTFPWDIDRSIYECTLLPYNDERTRCPNKTMLINLNKTSVELKIRHKLSVNDDHPVIGIRNLFRNEDLKSLLDAYDSDMFLLCTNRGVTLKMFENPYHGDYLRSLGLRPETAFPCLFQYLFKINNEVCVDGCKVTEQRLVSVGEDTIRLGLMVRHSRLFKEHLTCLESLVYTYQSQGKRVLILTVTESIDIQHAMRKRYDHDMLLFPAGDTQPIITVHDRSDKDKDCQDKQNEDRMAMLHSARDLYLLSLTDVHVVSGSSGFGIMGAMMRPRLNPVVYKAGAHRICNESLGGDSLKQFGDDWSGFRHSRL